MSPKIAEDALASTMQETALFTGAAVVRSEPDMLPAETIWINGKYMPLAGATLPIEDRATVFGDGIYEVIAAYKGVPVALEDHLDRWEESAAGLRIQPAYTREQRREVIAELLGRLGAARATLYGQLSRGVARRAHPFPANVKPTEFWFARLLPEYPAAHYTKGATAITHPDERWSRCWIKTTSLLANCLAKQAAVEQGAFEAILYESDGTVTEASSSNFHVVKDGIIYTHPTDGAILAGCTRGHVFRLARASGLTIREQKYSLDFMRSADEAFLTSTTINVMPITRIDGRPVAEGTVGPVTRRLMDLITTDVERIVAEGRSAAR